MRQFAHYHRYAILTHELSILAAAPKKAFGQGFEFIEAEAGAKTETGEVSRMETETNVPPAEQQEGGAHAAVVGGVCIRVNEGGGRG